MCSKEYNDMDSIYANLPHPDDFEAYLNENRDWYFSLCYSKIKENHEGDKLEEIDIMTFNFDDGDKTVYDITVHREDFVLNLTNCLKHYEEIEEYGVCSDVKRLIKELEDYYGL